MQQALVHTAPAGPPNCETERETIHDLRNLFGIVSSAKRLLEGHPVKVRRLALLQAIEAAALRGGELTTSLLSPPDPLPAIKRLDLNTQIMALEPLIRALARGVQFDLCDDDLSLRVDPDAIDAVIFEIIANAKAAGATAVTLRTRRAGARIWLTIADDGCGMDVEMLARVRRCEDRQGGHGAGLCRVQKFVRASGGSLHFRSRAGRGTAISLSLPAVRGTAFARATHLAICEPR